MRAECGGATAAIAGVFAALIAIPQPAAAQTTIAPIVAGDDPEFEITPITAGPLRISPRVLATTQYDSNVLASPEGTEIEDLEFIVRPEFDARLTKNKVRLAVLGFAQFSRFLDLATENSDTYGLELAGTYSPAPGNSLGVQAGFARLAEDRGDPEARDIAGPGPRLIDTTFGIVQYQRQGGRILLDLEAEARELDAVSPFDDDRDFTSYSGRATVGYRVSGPVFATLTAFVNARDFRLPATALEPDRDATTYGGRAGVTFVESERFRGRAGVGVFRFEPEDPRLDARSGLSADVSMAYFLTRRAALVLDAFRGDVATFRRGAQARTDTRTALVAQVEMRHNFYGRAGLRWRKTVFVGSGIEEQTYGPMLALEYLLDRRLSLIANLDYSKRISDDLTEEFERFRGGITVRFRF